MDTVFDARAILFDLDGVLTPTADLHMQAWSTLFNRHFEALDAAVAPYTDDDYFAYVDGRPRADGVRAVLVARDLPSDDVTVARLGEHKNDVFLELLAAGIAPYPGSVAFLDEVTRRGLAVAVVSSSRNAPAVLRAAGLADRFEVVVDGAVAAAEGLPGKPAPDTFELAARLLGVADAESVVIEDAISGVRAGAAGDFGLVVAVDRGVGERPLRDAGADVVVDDLGELLG